MALSLLRALRAGWGKISAPSGIFLLSALFLLNLINGSLASGLTPNFPALTTVSSSLLSAEPALFSLSHLSLNLILLVASFLLTFAIVIVAARTFAKQGRGIATEFYQRKMMKRIANLFLAGFLLALLVLVSSFLLTIGSSLSILLLLRSEEPLLLVGGLCFLLPALLLLASFSLYPLLISVEDYNFLKGLRGSWRLTSGHRAKMTVLIGLLMGISYLLGMVGQQLGSAALTYLISSFVMLYGLATLAQIYQQLT